MAETYSPKSRSCRKPTKRSQRSKKQAHDHKAENPPSWGALKGFFSCKDHHQASVEDGRKKCRRIGCNGSLCNSREASSIIQRPETTTSEAQKKCVISSNNGNAAVDAPSRSIRAITSDETRGASASTITTSSSTLSTAILTTSSSFSSSASLGSFRVMRKLSGCYECHMADPITGVSRNPSMRNSVNTCPDCGEIFVKAESLELHKAVRHAVSELGPEDTSRNIVEIIFQSSWLKKTPPVCKIDRILKVHNTQKTIAKFEDYRDSIKTKCTNLAKKHPRCVADGNELLRFYCTTLTCSLGLNGSTNLCNSIPHCSVCSIVRDGFKIDIAGKICTMATSGKAHDAVNESADEKKRAMLVCRVIAGRVTKNAEVVVEECDSVLSGGAGVFPNMDELSVFNSRAILPCFVVVYMGF